jgi:hypothetical protein
MTAPQLVDKMRERNVFLHQRLAACLAAVEGHRWTDVELLLFTCIADCETQIDELRELKQQLQQLSLFP